ncbi:MAG TPA: hypothetical protein VFX59_02940 [Polyangiales bacterium]|nr:hypothetical protein [Polyangiales bacterium]
MDATANRRIEHSSLSGPFVRGVRGSLIVSSLATLRDLSLFDRYQRVIDPEVLAPLQFAIASTWLPVELAMAHYAACDALKLTEVQMKDIGEHVSEKLVSTFWGAALREARKAGAAVPYDIALKQYGSMWDRIFQGGSSTVEELGHKDARIHARGLPMVRYRYFQVAYVGLIRGAAMMFFRACHVKVERITDDQLTVLVSWV